MNKVASAHLRLDIHASSLPDPCKERLLQFDDRRITQDGVIVIKAWRHRTREKNLEEAWARLKALIHSAAAPRRPRVPTRLPQRAESQRLQGKKQRSLIKALRRNATE